MTAAAYNGNGLRTSTTITPAGESAIVQGYVWNTTPQVPQLLMDGANAYIYDGGTAPAEQVSLSAGTITYLVSDSLGSVRGTVNSSGALTGTTSYDARGNPQTSGGLTSTTPFGYAGGYTDPDGLIYLLSRYYQPSIGQFTSLDPEVDQTLAPYGYGTGNPVSYADASGLSPLVHPCCTGDPGPGGGGPTNPQPTEAPIGFRYVPSAWAFADFSRWWIGGWRNVTPGDAHGPDWLSNEVINLTEGACDISTLTVVAKCRIDSEEYREYGWHEIWGWTYPHGWLPPDDDPWEQEDGTGYRISVLMVWPLISYHQTVTGDIGSGRSRTFWY